MNLFSHAYPYICPTNLLARKIQYTILKGGAYTKKTHQQSTKTKHTKKWMGLHTTKCYVLFQSTFLRQKIGFTEELWILVLKATTFPPVPDLVPADLEGIFSYRTS